MSSNSSGWTRRELLKLIATFSGGIIGGAVVYRVGKTIQQPSTSVTILKAESYEQDVYDHLKRGLSNYPETLRKVKGGRVVLKPNLIEYYESRRVNTNPAIVAAAIKAFRYYGAQEVIVAEGPGHRRDMEILLEQSSIDDVLAEERVKFVDLNLDDIAPIKLSMNYTKLGQLYFPTTILSADLVVSMPKLKVHHWAGVTLSLKNMFGVVPGVKYGWPKNLLHWRGIHESITDINLAIQPGFTIIDGIEGMEGDGPLYGDTVNAGVILMGDNLTATDATAARLMGVYPERIRYFALMAKHGGTINAYRIKQLGEKIAAHKHDFKVLKHLASIKKPPSLLTQLRTGS